MPKITKDHIVWQSAPNYRTIEYDLEQFTSMKDALDTLGSSLALKYLNYAHMLTLKSKAMRDKSKRNKAK